MMILTYLKFMIEERRIGKYTIKLNFHVLFVFCDYKNDTERSITLICEVLVTLFIINIPKNFNPASTVGADFTFLTAIIFLLV